MAGSSARRRGIITEINVTPLVDIMLVLLIIFMLTANLIAQAGDRGRAAASASQSTSVNPTTLAVTLTREGALYLNGKPTTPQALRDAVPRRGREGSEDPGDDLRRQVGVARPRGLGARRREVAGRDVVRDPDRSHGDDGTRRPMIRDARLFICAGLSLLATSRSPMASAASRVGPTRQSG